MARKKEKAALAVVSSPANHPPMMVLALRLTPRQDGQALESAHRQRLPHGHPGPGQRRPGRGGSGPKPLGQAQGRTAQDQGQGHPPRLGEKGIGQAAQQQGG